MEVSARTGGDFERDYRAAAPNAKVHWLRQRGGVFLDDQRHPAGLRGVLLDIDESKLLECALRAREEHLQSILQTVPDAMIVIDENGVMQSFSTAAERLFGFNASEGDRTKCVRLPHLEDELVRAIRELTAQIDDAGDRPADSTMENSLGTIP